MIPILKNRIFVDCHVFDNGFQGTRTYIKGLYGEMIKDSTLDFFLAANDVSKLKAEFGEHDNVTYIQYESKNKIMRLSCELPKLLKRHKIDWAHFQYVVPPFKVCRYIVTTHDVLFMDFPQYFPMLYKIKNRLLFKWSAKMSDIILTVSEYSKNRIQQHFRKTEILITPNAVDPVFFEPYDKAIISGQVNQQFGLGKYWLFVSRWEPRKNHHLLLRTFVENGFHKDYQLVFIGDHAIADKQYESYFNSLDAEIKNKVHSFNKVKFNDLVLLVRGAALSVYPSVAEGFGIPPLESLAAGIPTVCSNTTAMSDFTFMSDCLFDPMDKEDMYRKIVHALNDESIAVKRDALSKKYTWIEGAERLRKAIKSPT